MQLGKTHRTIPGAIVFDCTLELMKTEGRRIIEKTNTSIMVEAEEYVHAVALEGNAVFHDNYFALLPGQRRTVSFASIQNEDPEIACFGVNIDREIKRKKQSC